VEHTNVHFLSEQLAMKLHAYEASESHLLEHQRLLAELRNLKGNLATGKPSDNHGLVEALRGWIIAHIETADKALAEYLATQTVPPK
jgi:hemerythrin-like metal-binding protein